VSLSPAEAARRSLVPKWIQAFSWFFLVGLVAVPVLLVVGLFYKKPMQFSVYGWGHPGTPYELGSLLVMVYFGLCGVAALGLLTGKRWGWLVAFGVGVVGLGLSLTSPFVAPSGHFRIPLEPLALIPFLVVLWRIHDRWHSDTAAIASSGDAAA
jgi:hypothetical protein